MHARVRNMTQQIPPSQVISDSTMLSLFDDDFQPIYRENNPLNIPVPLVQSHQGAWNNFSPSQV